MARKPTFGHAATPRGTLAHDSLGRTVQKCEFCSRPLTYIRLPNATSHWRHQRRKKAK